MKKTLIVILFTALISISIVFMTPKKAEAETTQDITPFYGGDLLDSAELYLFQDYTQTPNFENGYLSKKTISSQDVYYSNSVATHFNGWYKDLGMSLIDDYTTEETAYFWFYIPFNDLLARYFQLAIVVSTPFEGDYVLKYKDENPQTILTSGDYSRFLLMSDQGDKYIEWFAYQVYYPDYLTSFRPLTAQLSYEFGYDSGESAGFDSGYNSGYNYGYSIGYDDGVTDATTTGYYDTLNFNQIVQDGNFTSASNWTMAGATITTTGGEATITSTQTSGGNVYASKPHRTAGHIYYLNIYAYTDSGYIGFRGANNMAYLNIPVSKTEYTHIQELLTATGNYDLFFPFGAREIQVDYISHIKNFYMIDLTNMFGYGNEPTLEECLDLFPSSYYDYTLGTPTSINYLDGYNVGMHEGYTRGSNAESTKQLTATGWIQNIFTGMGSLLGLQIFPGVTIGLIVGIPFVISLAYFVIRAFRGGGGA